MDIEPAAMEAAVEVAKAEVMLRRPRYLSWDECVRISVEAAAPIILAACPTCRTVSRVAELSVQLVQDHVYEGDE